MSIDAAMLHILHYPAPALRTKAAKVPKVTTEVATVARRMIDLMHEAEGIGLAAPQVGLPWRLFVVDIPDSKDHPLTPHDGRPPESTAGPVVYVNPVLSVPIGPPVPFEEGCLSLPEIRGEVLRPPQITITAIDLNNQTFSCAAGGLLARCWQHEMDHLDGVLIIDRMTQLSRLKVRSAVRDLERAAGSTKK